MLKQASKDHSEGKIPTRNQEMLKMYRINDESRNIDSNFFLKAKDEKWSTTLGMTIFSLFQEETTEYNLGKNLSEKCIVLHVLIPNQS